MVQRASLPRWGTLALACLMGIFTSGCLVTDQIDLPPRAQTPPILSPTSPRSGRVIRFNTDLIELKLNLLIRDEDTTEVLKARWRLLTGNPPPRPPASPSELDYKCPELPILGTPGTIERELPEIVIPGKRLMRGQCYLIDVIVSSSFKSCERNPELFDITTNEDNEEDVGRASYVVLAVSGEAIDNDISQSLLDTCPYDTYQAPGAMTSPLEK